jgi:hypothetical protein
VRTVACFAVRLYGRAAGKAGQEAPAVSGNSAKGGYVHARPHRFVCGTTIRLVARPASITPQASTHQVRQVPTGPGSTVKTYLPWVVATALFMEQLDSTIVNTAVPAIAASLHVTPLSLKAVVASYILSLAVCIPVSGWMADRYGTRRVFGSAVAIFTLSSILCGFSTSAPMRVAARILQGIGAAMMMLVGQGRRGRKWTLPFSLSVATTISAESQPNSRL